MLRTAILLILLLPLGGCIDSNLKPEQSRVEAVNQARQTREQVMQDAWIGKSIQQVEASLGEPRMVMTIPGTSASSVVLYGVLDTGSNCIDAFRVAHGEVPTVVNYFCR